MDAKKSSFKLITWAELECLLVVLFLIKLPGITENAKYG
jgi:hypothetical protein